MKAIKSKEKGANESKKRKDYSTHVLLIDA